MSRTSFRHDFTSSPTSAGRGPAGSTGGLRRWLRIQPSSTLLAVLVVLGLGLAAAAGAQLPEPAFVEPDVTVLHAHVAENTGDNFGWVAESVGDLDGDGAPDYVIGAILNADGGPAAGKAYVYSGATGALLATHVGGPAQRLGFSVTGGADLDGDSVPDYAVGAPGFFGNPSRVRVYSGADHGLLREIPGPPTLFGYDLHLAGDLDADGVPDLIVGDPLGAGFAGTVSVFSGASGAPIWSTSGTAPGDLLGTAVSGLDDFDGDGIPEQGAGAGGDGLVTAGVSTGSAWVLDGASGALLRELTPNGTGLNAGFFFVHDAGDVNADGVGDVYMGDFGDSKGGRGYVYSGVSMASGEVERLRLINAQEKGDGLGMGRGAGDIDGDGHDDLLIGAFLSSAGAFQGGQCYLISGKNGQTLRTFTSRVENGQVGFDVVRLGDVTGDARTDFLLTGLDVAFVVAGNP